MDMEFITLWTPGEKNKQILIFANANVHFQYSHMRMRIVKNMRIFAFANAIIRTITSLDFRASRVLTVNSEQKRLVSALIVLAADATTRVNVKQKPMYLIFFSLCL